MKKIAFLTLALAALAASCTKEQVYSCNPGDEVHFAAGSASSVQGTKAAYDSSNDLKINWQDDDQIRIVCAQCSETKDALYKAVSAQSNGRAGLEPVNSASILCWGESTADHKFYAAYPGSNSISSGTLNANVAASQSGTVSEDASGNWTVAPAMSNMALVSAETTKPTSDALTFNFTPLTTAIELTITNKRGETMNVESIALQATATGMSLSGSYNADLDGTWAAPSDVCTNSWATPQAYSYSKEYPACADLTSGGASITIPTPASGSQNYIAVEQDKTLTATFFIQPTAHVYDLKFVINFSDDSSLSTVIKRVDQATDAANRITFPRHAKSYVSGIFVPEGAQWTVKLSGSSTVTPWDGTDDQSLTMEDGDVLTFDTPVVASWGSSSSDESLTAVPEGALPGVFSFSASTKMYFAKGNLQYQASTGTWRFAEHSWDRVANGTSGLGTVEDSNNASISSSYSGWIDLFGFGTSGWSSGATGYQPYYSSGTNSNYIAKSLIESYANADWGVYNAISNGGNQAGLWRTPTKDECTYVTQTRTDAGIIGSKTDCRYAFAVVNGIQGLLLFADDFVWPTEVSSTPSTINASSSDYNLSSTSYTTAQYAFIEMAGAVFLPRNGYRDGTTVTISNTGTSGSGNYWTSTYSSSNKAYSLTFDTSNCKVDTDGCCIGQSIRLITSAN